ncbi:bZIP transcription factor 23 [Impatiens glandulifera]|uniref:bZIP transcription factor 23 n=1 Tax=Impatiens glandulifera TaxID=253017 RepID=UPI001FB0EB0E|nr:bZIP transcription factor 23 [Impatiens glandulifera]
MNFGNESAEGTGGRNDGRPAGNFPLARQNSVYSLTFDEFQSTMGGIGKDFGSMNMDELLKNIWSAEEMQSMAGSSGGVQESNGVYGGSLQRQGSLTLPRTLSLRTVDEVWRDMSKEYGMGKDGVTVAAADGSKMNQRQVTLGEVTLEEFLVRAGVVKEDNQLVGNPNNNVGFYGDFTHQNNNPCSTLGLGLGFQQSSNNGIHDGGNNNQTANLPLNINGARLTQQQFLLPKQPNMVFATPMSMPMTNGNHLGSPSRINGNLMGMVGVGANSVTVANGSPAGLSSDGIGKSNGDSSSVSPVPYVFNGSLRGRKCSNAVEKVVERRQRRMIKNRESAARSRARKQAYTMELEAEVAKLKEENEQLRKKQAEILEMQKNQAKEMMNMQQGKRRCLRRTQTGPW